MKISYIYDSGIFTMIFHPEKGEGLDSTQKVKLGNKKCTSYLPKDLNIRSIHPDVLALVALLIVYPYLKSQIILPIGVSQVFHNEVKKTTGMNILPVNPSLKPRKAPADSIPGLAYSGGVDSTACLAIMPPNTCSVYHDRTFIKGEVFNKEAAQYACRSLKQSGRSIYMVKSDFDYVRSPKGYAVEMSTAIPALLLSDYLRFDSIAIGTTLEYFIDHFQYYNKRTYSIKWDKLFRIVDIHLNQPTAGISEIGNYIIASHSPYGRFAESCMSGSAGKPCMNCFKCFRKQLTKMVLQKQSVSDELLDRLFRIRGARAKLEKFPIFFENVITYITANYHGNHPLMNMLKKKTRGNITDVKWMEKWHSPSLKWIPRKYQDEIKKNIMKHLSVMSAEDETRMAKWQNDFEHVLHSPVIKKYHSEFVHAVRKLN